MNLDNQLFRFREDLKYISLDCETEGLNLRFTRPWQISWVVVENNKITKEFDLFPYIKDLKVSDGAAKATRFNKQDYLKKSTPAEEVNDILNQYLYNPEYKIVMQNGINYDTYILNNFRRYLNLGPDFSFLDRVYDTLALGRALNLGLKFPTVKEEILPWEMRLCDYRKKGLKASMEALCKQFDIPYDHFQAHNGLYDTTIGSAVFNRLVWSLEVW